MSLNKKRGLLVLSSLFLALLIPIVSAQYEGVYSMFSFLFGTGDGAFIFLKAGVWIILFAIIFWAAKKIFSGSKGIATIFSIVVSLISIRFIPDEYIYYIGSAYGVFGIVVLILAIMGGTLLILNSYFPIKQHKAFGVVWAMFYFFMAWVFHQLTDITTGIYQIDELLPVIGPWGKWVCIVLGIACLVRAFSGTSSYTRTRPSGDEKRERDIEREELERERRQHQEELNRMAKQGKKDVKSAKLEQANRDNAMQNRHRRAKWENELDKLRSEKNDCKNKAGNLHTRATQAGWTRTEAGRKLYKVWYREYSKVISLEKEIENLEKKLRIR
ncbi:hypothetical protein COY26_05395 [Candidatus Woesearchaeota archaeon CG_4_10_14_0_2_um_filter_33_10]|nr:MAG: hypothetical protein AUJ83_02790 [Candidatus Woesearchaeota archaeon CG1_02_33_12]PIN77546.1 MAG: hypothetical protein COV14_05680 [Candidatus Woesearchaeota archaeon CG10_big_fil_rev_8_21_14_0_10_33_12]PIU72220.1 MAG: hypothetical protein COS79_04095 [Candidatus Woesearchaeota archaeon CG06_land_8_20_14_3_00_33_13]PIZ51899.1 MAG: hypothetical protein COY26_05395 [Candidatus Woesearchaeota archaeon CG_4_10_14_0_2_um_filter_33_10]